MLPLNSPYFFKAVLAYSEQDGVKRQHGTIHGEINFLYNHISPRGRLIIFILLPIIPHPEAAVTFLFVFPEVIRISTIVCQ